MTAERVRAAVAAVTDPELRRPIGELDMVREIAVDGERAQVAIALTIVAFVGIDSAMRGRGVRFLLNYTIGMAIVAAILLMITHWQLAILLPGVFVVYSTARGNLRELRSLRAIRKRAEPEDDGR